MVYIETNHLVMPQDLNPHGSLFGGTMMSWMDKLAAIYAMKITRRNCVTKYVNQIEFNKPINVKDVVTLRASVKKEGTTSIVIQVDAFKRGILEYEEEKAVTAEFVFVSVTKHGERTVWNI